MNLSIRLLICLFLGVAPLGAVELSSRIQLQGSLTFAKILWEAERQLGIEFDLPREADNNSRRNYNQSISLKTLIKAIESHYGQEGLRVSSKVEGDIVRVRLNRPASRPGGTASGSVPQRKTAPPQRLQQRERVPVVKPGPQAQKLKKPDWLNQLKRDLDQMDTGRSRNPAPTTTRYPDLERQASARPRTRISMEDLPAIPPRGGSIQRSSVSTRPADTPSVRSDSNSFTVKLPSISAPKVASSPPSDRIPLSGGSFGSPEVNPRIKITPYPEDAVAFINDAPSIIHNTSLEKFVEWEARMQGSLEQGNYQVLQEEQHELERRLRWLRSRMR